MAKANLTLPDGTTVKIEGTAEEVALLITKCASTKSSSRMPARKKSNRKPRSSGGIVSKKSKAAKGPVGLITELAEEGFFKSKRMLAEIQKKLEEGGHIYAQTSLSPAALGLTKKKILRRFKEKKAWVYVRGSREI